MASNGDTANKQEAEIKWTTSKIFGPFVNEYDVKDPWYNSTLKPNKAEKCDVEDPNNSTIKLNKTESECFGVDAEINNLRGKLFRCLQCGKITKLSVATAHTKQCVISEEPKSTSNHVDQTKRDFKKRLKNNDNYSNYIPKNSKMKKTNKISQERCKSSSVDISLFSNMTYHYLEKDFRQQSNQDFQKHFETSDINFSDSMSKNNRMKKMNEFPQTKTDSIPQKRFKSSSVNTTDHFSNMTYSNLLKDFSQQSNEDFQEKSTTEKIYEENSYPSSIMHSASPIYENDDESDNIKQNKQQDLNLNNFISSSSTSDHSAQDFNSVTEDDQSTISMESVKNKTISSSLLHDDRKILSLAKDVSNNFEDSSSSNDDSHQVHEIITKPYEIFDKKLEHLKSLFYRCDQDFKMPDQSYESSDEISLCSNEITESEQSSESSDIYDDESYQVEETKPSLNLKILKSKILMSSDEASSSSSDFDERHRTNVTSEIKTSYTTEFPQMPSIKDQSSLQGNEHAVHASKLYRD